MRYITNLLFAFAITACGVADNAQPSTTTSTTTTSTVAPTTTTTTTTTALATTTTTTTLPDTACAEWYPVFLEAGWPADLWDKASKLIYRESRCLPLTLNQRSRDIGLWQINAKSWCLPNRYNPHPAGWLGAQGLIGECADLYNPLTNMRAALALYVYSEAVNGPGMGWHPWRTN